MIPVWFLRLSKFSFKIGKKLKKFHLLITSAEDTNKTAANSFALSFLKLYLIIPLINFYFQYLKFNTLFSTDRLCYIYIFIFILIHFF